MSRRKSAAKKLQEPVGLTYDLLHEIRRAMRVLRRAEKWITTAHRAEKRRKQSLSDEWQRMQRIKDEEQQAARARAKDIEREGE